MNDYEMLGMLGVFLGALWAFSVYILKEEIKTSRENARDQKLILEHIAEVAAPPSFNLDSLEDKLSEMLEDLLGDVMGNMQMPTATDHIMGAISNIIQHKMMKTMPPGLSELIPQLNEEVHNSDIHGQTQD